MECKCEICGRTYIYNRKCGHTLKKCNSCLVNIRRFKIKENAVKNKGGKCIICGYDKCIQALEFHHLNPNDKKFNISGSHSRKEKDIEKELEKCILVCANCHAEIEAGLHREILNLWANHPMVKDFRLIYG